MQTLLHSSASIRKALSILCAVSMLFISMAVSNATSRKFELTNDLVQPNESPAVEAVTFEKVWLEYNVKVDGLKGMRIHAKLTVKNNSNVECRLIANFYKRDGKPLMSDSAGLYGNSHQVFTFVDITPHLDITEFPDTSLFFPYRDFNITEPGVHPLKIVLFLMRYPQGSQLGKSGDVNFKYTKS
jgi:hypothetical protein